MPLGDVPRRRISVFRRRSDQPPELELELPELEELELEELEDDDDEEESLAPELDELELLESLAPELEELDPPYPPLELELESLAPELELELDEPLELELEEESADAPPELDELLEPEDELDEWPLELAELFLLPELRSLPSESALAKPMFRAPFFCVMRVWFLPFDLLSETQL